MYRFTRHIPFLLTGLLVLAFHSGFSQCSSSVNGEKCCPCIGVVGDCQGGKPVIVLEDSLPTCAGQTVTVTPEVYPPGGSYDWSGGQTTASADLLAGNHSLIYTTQTGCADTIPLVVYPVTNSINGMAFTDVAGDGTHDPSDPPFPLLPISLYTTTGDLIAVDSTDGSGIYEFNCIPPGDYVLFIDTLPNNHLITFPGIHSQFDPLSRSTPIFNIGGGDSANGVEVGLWPQLAGSISGKAWLDINGDGIQDFGEPPLQDFPIFIQGSPPNFNPFVLTTDANGEYTFKFLWPASNYQLFVPLPLPDDFSDITLPFQGTDPSKDSDFQPGTGFTNPYLPVPLNPNFQNIDLGLKPDTFVKVKVIGILAAAQNNSTGEMKDDIFQNGDLPIVEPYSGLGYPITENPSINLFPGNVKDPVDWVTIELRDKNDSTMIVASKAAIITKNGCIVDPETGKALRFDGVSPGSYFVALRHLNHLDIMTKFPVFLDDQDFTVDFTDPNTPTMGFEPQASLDDGLQGLWSGDGDQSGTINPSDKNNVWSPEVGQSGYKNGDFDRDGTVQPSDKNLYWAPNVGRSSGLPK